MGRIKPQDDELYRASKRFVKRALSALRERHKQEDLPAKQVRRIQVMGKGSYSARVESEIDYSMMVSMLSPSLERFSESHSLETAMKKHKTVGRHLNNMVQVSTHGRSIGWRSTAEGLLLKTLRETERLKFNRESFDSVFEQFMDSFRQRKFRFRAFALIYNFDSDLSKLALTHDKSIRRLKKEELEALFTSSVSPFDEGPIWELLRADYVVEILFKERKKILDLKEKVEAELFSARNVTKEIMETVTLTRLLKPSSLCVGRIEVEQYDNTVFDFGYKTGDLTKDFILGPTSFYSKKELKDLVRLDKKWPQIDFEEEKDLYLAIQRYDLAQRRTRPDDRLIDYIIALEALLTKDSKRVHQRLPILASEELIRDYPAAEVRRTIELAIRYRNSILHAKPVKTDIRELETTVGEYVSAIARKRLLES
ncbi:MAG: hypothetical protein KAR39_02830 [Thermoplasmata archaeon]|nr:hypothetical protein [Thermoplasmata archaeon]